MCHKSHQATHLLFKYYVSKLGGGRPKACDDNTDMRERGVQNLGKLTDVILEHSLNFSELR